MRTVTGNGWNVAVQTTTARPGAMLSVFRGFHNGRARYGDYNGRMFTTEREAWTFALEHGYTQPYYSRQWCRKHRQLHYFLDKPTPTFGSGADCDGCFECQLQRCKHHI